VESPLWLRRLAIRPMRVGYPGMETKLLRDCTDEEVRAIAAFPAQRGVKRISDGEDWLLRHTFERREQQRNPLEGESLLTVLGFV
jgi:hypothetical protein